MKGSLRGPDVIELRFQQGTCRIERVGQLCAGARRPDAGPFATRETGVKESAVGRVPLLGVAEVFESERRLAESHVVDGDAVVVELHLVIGVGMVIIVIGIRGTTEVTTTFSMPKTKKKPKQSTSCQTNLMIVHKNLLVAMRIIFGHPIAKVLFI